MVKVVAALYDEQKDAYDAIVDLLNNGIEREAISILSNNVSAEQAALVGATEKSMLDGTIAGAIAGALTGSVIGLAALAIPGIGSVLAAGTLFIPFIGGATGLVAGSLIGAFVDWDIRDTEADFFAEGVRRGGSLVAVKAEGAVADHARAILNRHHPVNMSERVAMWRKLGWTRFDSKSKPYTVDEIAQERAKYQRPIVGEAEEYSSRSDEKDTSLRAGKLPGVLSFEDREALFRNHYESTVAKTGKDFAFYLPAYLFGFDLAIDDRYAEKDWSLIEPDLRRFWDEHNAGTWDDVREAVRFARDAARGRL